jgi:uncharacterized membrane protein
VTEADAPAAHRDTGRLVALSDGVFAISITLLVLEIRPPTDDENLLHGLLALWPSYLAYAVTFLFIGQVWVDRCAAQRARPANRRRLLRHRVRRDGAGASDSTRGATGS